MVDEDSAVPGEDPAAALAQFAAELRQAKSDAERRQRREIAVSALADKVRVSRQSVYAYLNGTTLPSAYVLDCLLLALGITDRGRLEELRDGIEETRNASRKRSLNESRKRSPEESDAVDGRLGPIDEREPLHRPRPRQLLPVTPNFIGRHDELAELDQLAEQAERVATTVVLTGTAGAGKTTLALGWAHRAAARFPDGQLYVNLRGFDPGDPLDAAAALQDFLLALGVGPSVPAGLEARAARFRDLVAGRRLLVVLDSARSAGQARPLLPGGPGCLTIVTSRNRLESLTVREGARRVDVDVFSPAEAVALLTTQLRVPATEAGPCFDELARECAYLPLALSIAGGRAMGRAPAEMVGRLVTDLREARSQLDVLGSDDVDLDLRAVFQCSYDQLPAEASRLFGLLGVHPGPDIDRHACAALLDVSEPPDRALRGLTDAHLLDEHRPGRFASHDLLRGFARELAARRDEAETTAALGRLLDHYLAAAREADAALQPWLRPPAEDQPVPGTGWSRPEVADLDDAVSWFGGELPVLLAMVDLAAARGFESHVWRLAWALMVFLRRSGRRRERAAVQRFAVEAARRAGRQQARATSLRLLADAVARLDSHNEAGRLLAEALIEADDDGARQIHLSFARLFESGGDHIRALGHARKALVLAESGSVAAHDEAWPVVAPSVAGPVAAADSLTAVSTQLCHLGDYPAAVSEGLRALALYTEAGHLEGEAAICRVLGLAESGRGRHEQAIDHYGRSRRLDLVLGDRYREAQAMDLLADEYLATGAGAAASRWRTQALEILDQLSHPDAAVVRAKLDESPGQRRVS